MKTFRSSSNTSSRLTATSSRSEGAARDIDWSWLIWLALGNALFVSLGIAALAWLRETVLQLVIGALLLVAAVLMRLRPSVGLQPTVWVRLGTGLVSGLVNGVAAIGGIAVALARGIRPTAEGCEHLRLVVAATCLTSVSSDGQLTVATLTFDLNDSCSS